MIGQNLGAKQYDRAKYTTLCTVAAALLCACVSTAICLLFPKPVFSIFTNDQQVIDLDVTFLRIFCIHFFASAITGSFQAMVTGSGFVELGFILGLFDGLICKIGFSIIFTRAFGMGYEGIWLGIAFYRFIPGMICITYFVSGKWKTRKLLTD